MEHAAVILNILEQTYPDARCELEFNTPWQLLVATILSAQCTDVRVNKVTKELFKIYSKPTDYLALDPEELKRLIRPTGFFNQKAKFIKAAAEKICRDFNKKVPKTMAELTTIPGVARKTANVVLAVAYSVNEGIAVDTHVIRLSQRLGLSKQKDPVKIEAEMMKLYRQKHWEKISTLLIHHGRRICKARKPECAACPLNKVCPGAFKV